MLRLFVPARLFASSASSSSTTTSAASASPLTPDMFRLNALKFNDGAHQVKKRVGRGPSSGLGKTCGRGQKGQKSRSGGGVRPGFEGGQTPIYKTQRKFGFSNAQFRVEYTALNLGRLQFFIDAGRVDAAQPISMRVLVEAGVLKRNAVLPHGVKLLADGAEALSQPITVELADASAAAVAAVEKAGGKVYKVYFNDLGLRVHLGLYKHWDRPLPRYAAVPPAALAKGFVHPTATPSYLAEPDHEVHARHLALFRDIEDDADAELAAEQPPQPL